MDERLLLLYAKELRKDERNLRLAIDGGLRDSITKYIDKIETTVRSMRLVSEHR